ncbi:hypothetical protein ACSLUB_12375 [Bordetella hinzii]|uniref:hypothetical protein n=1 Tax=Bordetella hinzii TaxID=103855 RepID=UPI003F19E641
MNHFETNEVKRYEIRDTLDYQPIADLRHAAHVLIGDAKSHPEGSHYKWMAAVMFLASTVEAFCQTLGPEVLENWNSGKSPIERNAGPFKKLELIAGKAGLAPQLAATPWKDIQEIFNARNSFAHPKPATDSSVCVVECRYDELGQRSAEAIRQYRFPLLTEAAIDVAASSVDAVLTDIWCALGHDKRKLYAHGASIGSWSLNEPADA